MRLVAELNSATLIPRGKQPRETTVSVRDVGQDDTRRVRLQAYLGDTIDLPIDDAATLYAALGEILGKEAG